MRLTAVAIIGHVAFLVTAQGPGNGLSKSTYATSSGSAIPGLNFLLKLFPTTAQESSYPANIAVCPKGTAGQKDEWYITEGRSALIENLEVGTCAIKYGTLKSQTNYGVTSVTPPSVKGDDCVYSSSELVQTGGGVAYHTYAHTADTCCKACASDPKCTGAVYTSYTSSDNYGAPKLHNEGFGLHLPALPGHSTSGGLSVEAIEAIFQSKMASMKKFDWFMDYNVGLFTSSLDAYLNKLEALNIKHLMASWPTANDGTWYSVFIHVPNTQMIIELLGKESKLIKPSVLLEPRMTETRIKQVQTSPPEGMLITPVSVSRAISDIHTIDEFYVNGVGATVTAKISRSDVLRRCYQWSGAEADVCFTQRSESATSGTFKPKQFEDMLHANHAKYLTNPNCNMDRWEDNHYAVDFGHHSPHSFNFDGLLEYVNKYSSTENPIYYKCGTWSPHTRATDTTVHYVFDPSGWGIQLDGRASVEVSGCKAFTRDLSAVGRTCPWCTGGTCDSTTLV